MKTGVKRYCYEKKKIYLLHFIGTGFNGARFLFFCRILDFQNGTFDKFRLTKQKRKLTGGECLPIKIGLVFQRIWK